MAATATNWHVRRMKAAEAHLSTSHPAWAALIARIGPSRLAPDAAREPYHALLRAIAYQQLHARAAENILGRFFALYPGTEFPPPELVLSTDDATLRACGFSGSKVAAVRDIALKASEGILPTRRAALRLSDTELIARLTTIRGVGRWTVEMLLMFCLGRPDVLPVDDFGVREGYRRLHDLAAQPKPKELAIQGEAWAPYRSTAAWYLWRAADEGRKIKLPG